MSTDVAIVGAGLAGLACARELERAGISYVLFEKDGKPGGRVQTDEMDGFLLDRGFQVFLNAYPCARYLLDYDVLHLHSFDAGALLWDGNALKSFRSPVQFPAAAFDLLRGEVATLKDLLALARIVFRKQDTHFKRTMYERKTTAAFFQEEFSDRFQKLFLTPFFQGVFLERTLETDAAFCKFLLPFFGRGRATLPAAGMGAIPAQLASHLKKESLKFRSEVTQVTPTSVTVDNGQVQSFKKVVLAVDIWSLTGLLGMQPDSLITAKRGTRCLYFALDGKAPIEDPILVLNGSEAGCINSVCFPSVVASTYAPAGKTLCSVSIFDDGDAEIDHSQVLSEVADMLSVDTKRWRYLRSYRIPESLPVLPKEEVKIEGFVVAGDYVTHPSIEGALVSGRAAARQIVGSLDQE